MPTRHSIPFALAELREAKSIEFARILETFFIAMGSFGWEGNEGACGNSHAIGKCERAQREAGRDNW